MKLIVGLGNPGRSYKNNRHNIGFIAVDHSACENKVSMRKKKFNARYGIGSINGEEVIYMKPQTYMNRSGDAINHFIRYFSVDPTNDLMVIVDDIHLPFGRLRIRPKGSAGGHNGLKSIIQELKLEDFSRIRIGIGKPEEIDDLTHHVLGNFTREEKKHITMLCERVNAALLCWQTAGVAAAMQEFN